MSEVAANTIYVSEKAKAKVKQLMLDAGVADDPAYFLRVGVVCFVWLNVYVDQVRIVVYK